MESGSGESVGGDSSGEFHVEQILKHRMSKSGKQFLVRWEGCSASTDSWEPEENVNDCAAFDLYVESGLVWDVGAIACIECC